MVETYEVEEGKFLPILRNENPTPCDSCPKQSPERGKELVLHPRNVRLLDFYRRHKAMKRAPMPKYLKRCQLLQHNFHIIECVIKAARSEVKYIAMREAQQREQHE